MPDPKPPQTVLSRVMIEIVQEGDGPPFVQVKHQQPMTPIQLIQMCNDATTYALAQIAKGLREKNESRIVRPH